MIYLKVLLALAPVSIYAQTFDLKSLDKYAAHAAETVDISLDSSMLQLAGRFFSGSDPDEAKVKRLIAGLKGIYVRSFEFDKDGEYSRSDVEAIRAQLRAPEWSRIVGAHSRRQGEDADVFVKNGGGKRVEGLAIIAAGPRELTVVSIVGAIDPEELRQLGGNFGIPKIELDRKPSGKEAQ